MKRTIDILLGEGMKVGLRAGNGSKFQSWPAALIS